MTENFLLLKKGTLQELSNNIDDYPGGIVILLDKPLGWTSADAVRRIKFLAQKHFRKKFRFYSESILSLLQKGIHQPRLTFAKKGCILN